jgi:hypothetical protein
VIARQIFVQGEEWGVCISESDQQAANDEVLWLKDQASASFPTASSRLSGANLRESNASKWSAAGHGMAQPYGRRFWPDQQQI